MSIADQTIFDTAQFGHVNSCSYNLLSVSFKSSTHMWLYPVVYCPFNSLVLYRLCVAVADFITIILYHDPFYCHACTYRALPVVTVAAIFTMIVVSSNYILVTEANDCSCWCLPTLGNVLPLAISVDNVSTKPSSYLIFFPIYIQLTRNYVHYVYILETAYGAIVGTNYLLVFVLLIIVYSKSLVYIKQLRKQLGKDLV